MKWNNQYEAPSFKFEHMIASPGCSFPTSFFLQRAELLKEWPVFAISISSEVYNPTTLLYLLRLIF